MATRSSKTPAQRASRSAGTTARTAAHTPARSGPPPTTPRAITFVMRGAIDAAPPASASRGGPQAAYPAALPAGLLRGEVRHSLRLPALRSAAAGNAASAAETRVEALPGRDVVVLHVAGGPSLVLHPENARALLRAQRPGSAAMRGEGGAAGDDDDAVTVSSQLAWSGLEPMADDGTPGAARGTTRGLLGDALLSGLEIISGVAGEQLAAGTAALLAARIDAKVDAGLHALQAGALLPLKASDSPAMNGIRSSPGK